MVRQGWRPADQEANGKEQSAADRTPLGMVSGWWLVTVSIAYNLE